jgi:hypothetical protein
VSFPHPLSRSTRAIDPKDPSKFQHVPSPWPGEVATVNVEPGTVDQTRLKGKNSQATSFLGSQTHEKPGRGWINQVVED